MYRFSYMGSKSKLKWIQIEASISSIIHARTRVFPITNNLRVKSFSIYISSSIFILLIAIYSFLFFKFKVSSNSKNIFLIASGSGLWGFELPYLKNPIHKTFYEKISTKIIHDLLRGVHSSAFISSQYFFPFLLCFSQWRVMRAVIFIVPYNFENSRNIEINDVDTKIPFQALRIYSVHQILSGFIS